MFRYAPLVVKNCLRNRRRSILTVLSITLPFCVLGVLMAMYHAFYFSEATPEQALRLITRNRISLANPLPASYGERIRRLPGVREVMILQWFGGIYKDTSFENFFAQFAVEPDKVFTFYPEYSVPEDQKKAFQGERTACLVGRPLARRFGWRLGDRVTLMGDIYPVDLVLTIRAIYDAKRDNENMMFHYGYLRESVSALIRDSVGAYSILAASPDDVPRIARAVDDTFRNSPAQTKTEPERAFELSFLAFLGNVKLFLLAVSAAITFTLLLVCANTMAMSVRERFTEVGILKTLGFAPSAILSMFLAESIAIALAGTAMGLVLAEGLCSGLRQTPITFVDLKMLHVPSSVLLAGVLLAVLLGVGSAIVPAWSASRRSIVDCLRFSD